MAQSPLAELEEDPVERVLEIEKAYRRAYGENPKNVSSWDPCSRFKQEMNSVIRLPDHGDLFDYRFPLPDRFTDQIRKHLRNDKGAENCLIVSTGTEAIAIVMLTLYSHNHDSICLVQPCYFTVKPWAEQLGFNVTEIWLEPSYQAPDLKAEEDKQITADVIWLTVPVYCGGADPGPRLTKRIKECQQAGQEVILDATLAEPGRDLPQIENNRKSVISIHTPHKFISTNSLKFGALIFPNTYEEALQDWSDLIVGNYSRSVEQAIQHFLGSNWEYCMDASNRFRKRASRSLKTISHKYPDVKIIDEGNSFFVPIIVTTLPIEKEYDIDFIRHKIFSHGMSFFPLYRAGFLRRTGFGFRINLFTFDQEAINQLPKLLDTLTDYDKLRR